MALVLDSPADLWSVVWELLRIGYPLPVGWLAGGMLAWRTSGREVATLAQISVGELRSLTAGEIDLLDVRQPGEWGQATP